MEQEPKSHSLVLQSFWSAGIHHRLGPPQSSRQLETLGLQLPMEARTFCSELHL
jgi:hypothetical protein